MIEISVENDFKKQYNMIKKEVVFMKKIITFALVLALFTLGSGCVSKPTHKDKEEDITEVSTEVSTEDVTEDSDKINYDKIYNEYVKTNLATTYGVFDKTIIETDLLHQTSEYANPGCWCRAYGILSVKISDLNNDEIPELIVPYLKKTQVDFESNLEFNSDYYASLNLKICTYNGETVQELSDVRLTEVVDYQWQDFKMFISEHEDKDYLCFYQNVVHADFGPEVKMLYIYFDDTNNLKYDVLYAPIKNVKYSLYKGTAYEFNKYDYNDSGSDYYMINKDFNYETYKEDEEEYWRLFNNDLSHYGLSLGENGTTVFRNSKEVVLGENTDIIFSINSKFDRVEQAIIKDYTNAVANFSKYALSENDSSTDKTKKDNSGKDKQDVSDNKNKANIDNSLTDEPENNGTAENIQKNPDQQSIIPQGNYKDDFINALLNNEELWYYEGNYSTSFGFASAISFVDLNFDDKPELIMAYGGGSMYQNPADVFYFENGQIAKAEKESNLTERWFEDTIEIYYDTAEKKYKAIGIAHLRAGYMGGCKYFCELTFDGKNMISDYFAVENNENLNGTEVKSYNKLPGYEEISEDEYNTLQAAYIGNCQNAEMKREKIFCRDWNNYSIDQKREALNNSYDSFTYTKFQ